LFELKIRSFRRTDSDTDHYLVVVKVRERLAVSKHTTQKFAKARFNLKRLKELMGEEGYRVEISNRLAGLKTLDDDVHIYRGWKHIILDTPNFEDQVPVFTYIVFSPGTGWPSYTRRHWIFFSSPPTTRRATMEVFEPTSTED
jgi:hypothetical protein